MERIHGTCVAINGDGVLFRGPPGSGKSDLALRIIDSGGQLIADDQTIITRMGDRIITSSPASIRHKIEVRGIGIMTFSAKKEAPLTLILDMLPPVNIERIPQVRFCDYLDVKIPVLGISPFENSATTKVKLAINLVKQSANN
jgi:HPr kinase/phosphorylase